jgi:hypothetical protein
MDANDSPSTGACGILRSSPIHCSMWPSHDNSLLQSSFSNSWDQTIIHCTRLCVLSSNICLLSFDDFIAIIFRSQALVASCHLLLFIGVCGCHMTIHFCGPVAPAAGTKQLFIAHICASYLGTAHCRTTCSIIADLNCQLVRRLAASLLT